MDEVRRLVHEELSLRRVAEVVATAGPSDDILSAICRAASDQLDGQAITLLRFVTADTIVAVATYGGPVPPGVRVVHQPGSMSEQVARTNQAVRVDDFARLSSAGIVGKYGIRAGVGVPIIIDGRVWGMFSATSQIGPLPLDTETRLEGFAQLMWAAIATTDARESLQRLVDEQAALRHVAELVARESPPSTVIDAVVREAARVLEASSAAVIRDEGPRILDRRRISCPRRGRRAARRSPGPRRRRAVGHAHGDLSCHGPPGRPRPAQAVCGPHRRRDRQRQEPGRPHPVTRARHRGRGRRTPSPATRRPRRRSATAGPHDHHSEAGQRPRRRRRRRRRSAGRSADQRGRRQPPAA